MLCPTRWAVRHTSIDSIICNYKLLQTAVEEIQQGHNDYAAIWLVDCCPAWKTLTLFLLKACYLLFLTCEQLSINLQAKDIAIQEAVRGAKLLRLTSSLFKVKAVSKISMMEFTRIAKS